MVADTVLESRAYALEGAQQETVSFGGDSAESESEARTARV